MKRVILKIFHQFEKYTSVGIISFTADMVLLYAFTSWLGVFYLFSAFIAYLLSNTLGFFLNRQWTFHKRKESIRKEEFEYLKYIGINVAILVADLGLLYVFVTIPGFWYVGSQAFILSLLGLADFFIEKEVTFHC